MVRARRVSAPGASEEDRRPSKTFSKPEVISTHISHLFLLGDRAYKVKRHVSFPFVDLSTVEKRRVACEKEVRLNRRLAPDVYLGVGRFVGPDEDEPVVVMRRMPPDTSLAHIVTDRADPSGALRDVARRIAVFHESCVTNDDISANGTALAVRDRWFQSLREMDRFVGTSIRPERFRDLTRSVIRFFAGREELFAARVSAGCIRDGHGDLKADDIFCLDDGPPCILDCLEFDDHLRWIDVIEDCASLTMDLERLGRPDLAEVFVATYLEFTGDGCPSTLVHHYIAYRALVRAKVACIAHEQGDAAALDQARTLLGIAANHLDRATVRLVLIGGLPGTGKTTVANELADSHGWTVVSSDRVRKELMGAPLIGVPHAYGADIYRSSVTRATYREMLERARKLLRRGESVILDASWSDRKHRRWARAVAEDTASDVIEIRCELPTQIAARRLRSRPAGLSDATPEIAAEMAHRFSAWPEATSVDTSDGDALAAAEAALYEARMRKSLDPSIVGSAVVS